MSVFANSPMLQQLLGGGDPAGSLI